MPILKLYRIDPREARVVVIDRHNRVRKVFPSTHEGPPWQQLLQYLNERGYMRVIPTEPRAWGEA